MLVAAAPVTCTCRPPLVVSAASVGVPQAGVFWTKVTVDTDKVVAAAFAPLTIIPSISQAATSVVPDFFPMIVPLNLYPELLDSITWFPDPAVLLLAVNVVAVFPVVLCFKKKIDFWQSATAPIKYDANACLPYIPNVWA